jgi:formylglycine-generating enzyme required for sulfatase activity
MRLLHRFTIYIYCILIPLAAYADDRDSALTFPSEYRYTIIEPVNDRRSTSDSGTIRVRVPEGDFLIGQPERTEDPLNNGDVKRKGKTTKREEGPLMAEDMVLVPEGEALIGLPEGIPGSDRNPLRTAAFTAFLIDRREVTNAQYKECVADGGCTVPSLIIDYPPTFYEEGKEWYQDHSRDDFPVVGLTWRQATEYCRWADKRLPTADEWEKAARGTDGRTYPWGNIWDGTRANWDDAGKIDEFEKISPVGSFPQGASPYGAEDMAGNVREWVDDLILKGGSWYSDPVSLRSGDPGHGYIVERDDDMGFRCIRDVSH